MRTRSSSNNTPAEFFKVFLTSSSHELLICSSFKPQLGRKVGGKAIITRSGTNREWKVDLVVVDGEFFFRKGWNEFVTQNSITVGEFLLFEYHGKLMFSVKVFGTNCLLRDPDTHMFEDENGEDEEEEEEEEEDEEEEEEEDDDDDDDDDGDESCDDMSIVRDKRGRRCEFEKGNRAMLAAMKLKAKLKNPSFTVCVTRSGVKANTIHLPSMFKRLHMKESKDEQVRRLSTKTKLDAVELQVCDKTWRVNVWKSRNKKVGKTFYRLGGGIGAFIKANNVVQGDVCIFEALDSPATTFKVFIFGANHRHTLAN